MFGNKRLPINLSEDEEVVVSVSKHWIRLFSARMGAFIIAIIVLALSFYTFNSYLGQTGKLIFLAVFISLIVFLAAERYRMNRDLLLITNQRLANIEMKGFFDKRVVEIHYDKIQSVSTTVKGIFKTVFNVGHITIKTGAEQGEIGIYFLPKPTKIQSLILDLQQKYSRIPVISDVEKEDEIAVNRQTLVGLLDYLKLEGKKDHFVKANNNSRSTVWKSVIQEYLESKQNTRIDKEPSYFARQRNKQYGDYLSDLSDKKIKEKAEIDDQIPNQ